MSLIWGHVKAMLKDENPTSTTLGYISKVEVTKFPGILKKRHER